MNTFIEFVAKGLVDEPEVVRVTSRERGGLTAYQLRVSKDDAGKIIGRRGATINALRALVQVGGAKAGRRCTLDLLEE